MVEAEIMKDKIVGILTCVMLVLTAVIMIVPDNLKVEATSGGGGEDDGSIGLDYQLIYDITKNLSWVVYDAPLDYGMQKGRAFGTTGEWYAADLIEGWMEDSYEFMITES